MASGTKPALPGGVVSEDVGAARVAVLRGAGHDRSGAASAIYTMHGETT